MGRRIIYIRNPSSGSNFRTIEGSGTSKGKKPKKGKPYKPKPPKIPKGDPLNDTGQASGYLPGYQAPKNWWVHSPADAVQNFGSYTGQGGVGPTDLGFTDFVPDTPYQVRDFEGGELFVAGALILAAAPFAPEVFAGSAGLEGAAAWITGAGYQAGAIGINAVALGGDMGVLDAPFNRRQGDKVYSEYPDVVSWLKSKPKNKQPFWIPYK